MKKPIGYKIGGVTHFPQEPSFGALLGNARISSPEGVRSAPLLKVDLSKPKTTEDKHTRPTTHNSKPSPPEITKTLVQATEEEKIHLIRNMIKDELAKERKAVEKCNNQGHLLEQVQHLNMDITLIQNRLCQLEERQGSTEDTSRQLTLELHKSRQTKDTVRSKHKDEDRLAEKMLQLQAKIKEVEGSLHTQLETVQNRFSKSMHDMSIRLDRELKSQSTRTASQPEHYGDNLKKTAGRLITLQNNVSTILQKLEGYNSVLEEMKDMNPTHTIKLTELVGRVAEDSKLRKKEMQELRMQHQHFDKELLQACQKMESHEAEVSRKMLQLERDLSQTGVETAVRQIKQQVQQQANVVEQLNQRYHQTRDELEALIARLYRLESQAESKSGYSPSKSPNKEELTSDFMERVQHMINIKLNDILVEYNGNFKYLDQGLTEVRDGLFEMIAVNQTLTQKLSAIYLEQNSLKSQAKLASSFRTQITKTAEDDHAQISELLQRGMSCEHELRLLQERLNQMEGMLSRNQRRQSVDSSDPYSCTAKQNKQPNDELRPRRRYMDDYGVTLLDQKIYDQLGMFD